MKKTFILVVALSCFSFSQAQVTTGSKLEFTYDVSGNQMLRDLNANSSNPDDPIKDEELPIIDTPIGVNDKFFVFPNPTSGRVTLSWDATVAKQITKIELTSLMTSEKQPITYRFGNSVAIDLSSKPPGLYLVVFYLANKQTPKVQKKIVKM